VKLSQIMPESDWYVVLSYCKPAGVNPLLIAAIGWHETHWGRLGMGKYGFYMGISCWERNDAQYEYDRKRGEVDYESYTRTKTGHLYCNTSFKGLRNQLKWAVNTIKNTMGYTFGYPDVVNLNKKWIPEDTKYRWAQSVWSIYNDIEADYPMEAPPSEPEEIPTSDDELPESATVIQRIGYYLQKIAELLQKWGAD